MSDKMLSDRELGDIVHRWARKHGTEKVSPLGIRYYDILKSKRPEAFSSLIKTLCTEHKYDRDDIEKGPVLRAIINKMAPDGATRPRQLRSWRNIITVVWNFEILEEFVPKEESEPKIAEGRKVSELEYIPPAKKEEYKAPVDELDTSTLKNPVPTPNFIIENDLEKLLDEASDE